MTNNLTPEEQQRLLEAADRILVNAAMSMDDVIDSMFIVGALSVRGVNFDDLLGAAVRYNPIILHHLLDELGLDELSELVVSKGQIYPLRITTTEATKEAIRQRMKEWGTG